MLHFLTEFLSCEFAAEILQADCSRWHEEPMISYCGAKSSICTCTLNIYLVICYVYPTCYDVMTAGTRTLYDIEAEHKVYQEMSNLLNEMAVFTINPPHRQP